MQLRTAAESVPGERYKSELKVGPVSGRARCRLRRQSGHSPIQIRPPKTTMSEAGQTGPELGFNAWLGGRDAARPQRTAPANAVQGDGCNDGSIPRDPAGPPYSRPHCLGLHVRPLGICSRFADRGLSVFVIMGLSTGRKQAIRRCKTGHRPRPIPTGQYQRGRQLRRPLDLHHDLVFACRPGPPRLTHSLILLSITSTSALEGVLQWLVGFEGIGIRQSGPFISARTAARH